MNPLTFFWLFLKASLLSTGGMGNLPYLHQDLTGLGVAKEADFVTAIAVGQLSPGPSGTWSVSLGYLLLGWPGAALATLALTLPTLIAIGVAAIYNRLERWQGVQDFVRGLSLGVVGLTLAVAYSLGRSSITDWRGLAICAGALALAVSRRVPVVGILALAALAGWLIYR
jgi:chromate transporter